jgi:S1-C subfamily serine protease
MGLDAGSPAQLADVRERDILVAFAGEPISSVDDLHRVLTEDRIGVSCEIMLIRRDQYLQVSIIPSESQPKP